MLTLHRLTYVLPLAITAMAIIENLWLRKSKKRLGGVVLYQAMEQTRARELASSVSNPRTASQMGQRVKWANLVNFYRVNSDWLKYAYETKSANQSEYNKFMSLNVADSQVFFTKQQAAAGSSIVCPYIMTQGSLPSIEFTEEAGSWPTNIYFPSGFFLLPTTTIAEFSQYAIQQNPAIRQGDQLSFVRFTQMFNSDTGYPYVIVRKYELVFDINSTELVGSYLPLDYIGVLNVGTPNQLGVIDSGLAGGFLLCLSRTQGGKTLVSSQRIITTRMDATIATYSSAQQLAAAVSSYGENADAFLSSTSANINSQAPTPLAIVGVVIGSRFFSPGSVVDMHSVAAGGDDVRIVFNSGLANQSITSASLYYNSGSTTLSDPTINNTNVESAFPASATFNEGIYLVSVFVRFSEGLYTAQFQVPLDPNNSED